MPLANFYRIMNVRNTPAGTVLDLQTPVRGYSSVSGSPTSLSGHPTASPGGTSPSPVVLIIQESLVEVIDIGPLR